MSDSLNLEMQFVEASFTFDHKQLIINFIADERIDFRELVKLLAAKYKARIDLHQIGVRDKAKEIGGLGPCGRPLCCNLFLNKLETITIPFVGMKQEVTNGSTALFGYIFGGSDGVYQHYQLSTGKDETIKYSIPTTIQKVNVTVQNIYLPKKEEETQE